MSRGAVLCPSEAVAAGEQLLARHCERGGPERSLSAWNRAAGVPGGALSDRAVAALWLALAPDAEAPAGDAATGFGSALRPGRLGAFERPQRFP